MSIYPDRVWESPRKVVLSESRWTATLTITAADGTEETVMLSADAGHTERNGIFVGTPEEADDMLRGGWA